MSRHNEQASFRQAGLGSANVATPKTPVNSWVRSLAAQLKQYHAQQFVTSRMLLVVVGNIDRAQLERLVRGTLATMPRGSLTESLTGQLLLR